ncbi:MAG: glycosyltransferase [Candidatus Omnitrophota bacterium]
MMAKKVLIVYSTAGAGHKKAAFAIMKAFEQMRPDAQIDIIDALDYTSAFFKWTYPRIYIFMVSRIPLFWGISYYILDNKFFYSLVSWIRHLTNRFHARALERFMSEGRYDVIISTHFLPTDVISMAGKKKIPSRLINVVTDYRMHTFWYARATDFYIVAHELTKRELINKYRVPEEKIKIFGIPIDPIFSKVKDRDKIRADLGIEKDRFTVLIGSGGFGVGPIVELVESFKGISIPVQLLVVCGKNEPLCMAVGNLQSEVGVPIAAYGFVENMDELMGASDIIITKTGALMSSEALAKGLPIIGIAPIPGQETRNFRILFKIGVALKGDNVREIPMTVKNLFNNKESIADIKRKIEAAKKPDAAFAIARFSMEVSA